MIIKNPIELANGNIKCILVLNGREYDHTMTKATEYEIHEGSEWSDIKPCPQAEKDAINLKKLQGKAISVMASTVIAECKSGTGKLYFSNIESAAMYTSAIQEDAEIRARAEQLMLWSFAIDTYALSVVFDIDEGGDIPTIEEFIAGLPTI